MVLSKLSMREPVWVHFEYLQLLDEEDISVTDCPTYCSLFQLWEDVPPSSHQDHVKMLDQSFRPLSLILSRFPA